MNNVFVYCEIEGTTVQEVSQELLTKGRKLANQLGVELHAIAAGAGIKGHVEEQILPYGVDKLFVFDGAGLFPYTSAPHTDILVHLFKEEQPQICLLGATVIGRDLGPRVSSSLTSGLTADCTQLEIGDYDEKKTGKHYANLLYQIRPAFGGNIVATIVNPDHRPQMATVRSGVMQKALYSGQAKGEVVYPDVAKYVPAEDYVVKVMNNLLSNAFKFTPEYGKVSVVVWREGDLLQIEVSDTGKGIDPEALAYIFEPFYQAESDVYHIGTGVGLALVKQIMDAIDGKIRVESAQGKGTTFYISVPIHNYCQQPLSDEMEYNQPFLPEGTEPLEDSAPEDSRCHLLIVEDNRDIAAYIGSQLANHYAISYAANGLEGLEKAQELVPDLIITDLMMPEMDGLELCRQVRKNEIISHIPIIVVTAKISEEERIKGIEAGADAYLAKPFNSDELRTRVEKLLEGRRLLQEKFMQTMIESKEGKEEEATQPDESDLRFLTKITDTVYLQLNRHKEVNVSLIASNMCMSSSQFYRKLVALTGYTPAAYIQRIKIKKAKILLDGDPNISFSEVADQCGFNNYSNFVRAFKNVCGITPTDYKKDVNSSL